ncbi:unannotated protein [freshwater metagenome]|uniref:Unannotated protein n=1 Tax=freshwater metagenome TaxID=449393 RepID=A0A6J6BKA4_9ZZZZ
MHPNEYKSYTWLTNDCDSGIFSPANKFPVLDEGF